MKFPGKSRSMRSALWAATSVVVALIGLVMSTHESGAHDKCVAMAQGLLRGISQSGLNCGFSNTVYWAGIVILVAGSLSTVAVAGSAISTATNVRRVGTHVNRRLSGWKDSGRNIDPTDPATRWQLDPATDWRPGPAGWQAGPAAADPFVPPVRRTEDTEEIAGTASEQSKMVAEDIVLSSRSNLAVLEEQAPTSHLLLPSPAWYPDPQRPEAIRWWDGQSWGESRPKVL